MGNKSCGTPPKDRKELGNQCEINLQKEYENKGYNVIKLAQNAPADLLVEKDGIKTFVEVKAGSAELTLNEKNFRNQVKNLGNDKINHKERRCGCDGNPIPDE